MYLVLGIGLTQGSAPTCDLKLGGVSSFIYDLPTF